MPVLDIDDPSAFEWKVGFDGRPVKVLADGVNAVRVRTMLRDSSTVAGQIARDRQRLVDLAGNDGLALHKPGVRRLSDESTYDASRAAYETMIRDRSEAWRRGPGHQDALAHGTEYSGHEGDPCTMRAGGADGYLEGSPGHIARVDGRLVCVPNEPALRRSDSMSASDAQAIKDKAYDEMARESEQTWKNLGRHG